MGERVALGQLLSLKNIVYRRIDPTYRIVRDLPTEKLMKNNLSDGLKVG